MTFTSQNSSAPALLISRDGNGFKGTSKSGKAWKGFTSAWSLRVWALENGFTPIDDFHGFGCGCDECVKLLYPGAAV